MEKQVVVVLPIPEAIYDIYARVTPNPEAFMTAMIVKSVEMVNKEFQEKADKLRRDEEERA